MKSLLCLVLGFVAVLVLALPAEAGGVQVNVANRGFFRGPRVRVNNGVSSVRVNSGFRNNAQINVINGAHVPFIPNAVRVNAFGTATAIVPSTVLEVNPCGQAVIRSSAFRGFRVNSFGSCSSGFCH